MENIKAFIESGILETYVMGDSTREEKDLVEQMAASFKEVKDEIDSISEVLEFYAISNATVPDPTIKPLLLATIDYTERIKSGEAVSHAPDLTASSTIVDYSPWLQRENMALPAHFTDFHAKIISYTPTTLTAIVWIKEMAPQEVHDHEYEKFLVVEGTCDITIGEAIHHLNPGDYLSIPLHKPHHVTVTSSIPCKVILQRTAA